MGEDPIEKAKREGAKLRNRVEAESDAIVSDYGKFLEHESEKLAMSGGYHPMYQPKSWLPHDKDLIRFSVIHEIEKNARASASKSGIQREVAKQYGEGLKSVLVFLDSYVDEDLAKQKKREWQQFMKTSRSVDEELRKRGISPKQQDSNGS